MKKITTLLIIASTLTTTIVNARQDELLDFARVLDVVPVYANVVRSEPQQECWIETVRYEYPQQQRSATPKILGALIGAAVGHNIARSKQGQSVGRVAGAVVGASVGSDIARGRSRQRVEAEYHDEERCQVREKTYYEEVVVGYDVTYEYHGNTYQTRMDQRPGRQIRVAVNVRPVL
ncbi:MAG: glycine zipper 2TM domain-containing protein [Gammaproteobacteria bacterium]|nr:glycine zipper 2TM domain-containing protein [Gammaproteobacteria bacterium]